MSDISVLSNQYEQLVATSDKVNNSVIAFKKKSILSDATSKEKYPKLNVSPEELAAAKAILLLFLDNIVHLIDSDILESDFIPTIILDDYKHRLSVSPFLKDELTKLIEILKQNQPVAEDNIQILDNILSILDNERSTLFRKLRTARG
jgi:hypothetical protein